MREVVLRLPRIAVEEVLDRLLPLVPGGVREGRAGAHAELVMRGPDVPASDVIAAAVARWPHTLAEREVADDWQERRRADYTPDVIGGRLVVRPEWAPPAAPGLIDLVLTDSSAFGGGTHPTTRTCLELLLVAPPSHGAFVDLGCGSGVLAILAAQLGWSPVTALDIDPASVETVSINAERNAVDVDARLADLWTEAPPTANGFAANVPVDLQAHIASSLAPPLPGFALCSGFAPDEADTVSTAYGRRGLREQRRLTAGGWSVLIFESV